MNFHNFKYFWMMIRETTELEQELNPSEVCDFIWLDSHFNFQWTWYWKSFSLLLPLSVQIKLFYYYLRFIQLCIASLKFILTKNRSHYHINTSRSSLLSSHHFFSSYSINLINFFCINVYENEALKKYKWHKYIQTICYVLIDLFLWKFIKYQLKLFYFLFLNP